MSSTRSVTTSCCVLVNYHRSPLGAWTATLAPDGLEPVTLQATSAHDALHDATDLIEVLSQRANAAVCTNTLDGDLAGVGGDACRRTGFVDCAITDSTLADLIIHK